MKTSVIIPVKSFQKSKTRLHLSKEKTVEISNEMTEIFGTLYGALEECAISETALSDNGFSGDWMSTVIELAVEKVERA